ncbi:MAG TPA: response regulator transcription factor, partial [Bryobacteraceae bacterium]|nr:response regulator transcription factor [Bryobacteraceae bacterium]
MANPAIPVPDQTPEEQTAAAAPRKIKVMIADDHPIVREGLRKLLLLEDDIDVVGEACDGRDLLDKAGESHPDVILLDLRMPNLDGLGALQTLQHTGSKARVI